MRIVLFVICLLTGILNALGQGTTIVWSTPVGAITTNDLQGHVGAIAGLDQFLFGLYAGPAGATESSLTAIAFTTNNAAVPGEFRSRSVLVPFVQPDAFIFQVRGWSAFAGVTYEDALAYAAGGGSPTAFLGQSALGAYITGSEFPLRSGTFVLTPVPEPSQIVLIGFGILAASLLRSLVRRER